MSSRKTNSSRRKVSKLDGQQIVRFLSFIGAMAGAMLVMAIVGLVLAPKEPGTISVYLLVIIVNAITVIAAIFIPRYVLKKFKDIERNNEVKGVR